MTIVTRRRRRTAFLTAAAALATATTTLLAGPAQSAPPTATFADCPDAYPVADLAANQPVTGLTVSAGNTPDTFTGEVLGVLKNGIAAGLDMIMVRLSSPEIDRVGGIWAGMSGSPVYSDDGRIIGAVSYGLAVGPSPVAGVTPAGDMQALVGGGPAAALRGTRHVQLTKAVQQRIVTDGLATNAEASQGLARLRLPLGVSGMVNTARLNEAASLIGNSDMLVYRAGAAPVAPTSDPDIFPGSNLAASMSYGDFSAVGTGTTTMVCNGQVIGFGHPFNWTGDSTLTLHGADAVYIQEDPTVAGFKVANPTGPLGTINGDHLAGISGLVGPTPDTTQLHSAVTLTGGGSRIGDTYVSVPAFLPDATALAELANQDRVFDRVGPGSSLVHFTVDGETSGGEPFTLVRTNRFASPDDISISSIFEAADDVARVVRNNFTDVTISQVRISAQLNPVDRAFHVGQVELKKGDHFVRLTHSSVVSARAGSTLRLRVTLNSVRNEIGSKVVLVSVKVPSGRVGSFGSLNIGQAFGGRSADRFVIDATSQAANSFDGLINRLSNAPRNDELLAEIDLFTRSGRTKVSREAKLVGDVVEGGRNFEFRVTR